MTPDEALARWPVRGAIRPEPESGLINRTWRVGDGHVLQWVNPIFDPRIHLDVDAVTRRLEERGVPTPRLVATRAGALWLDDPGSGYWRLWTRIPGRTLHRVADLATAAEAGALVGRFHAALDGWGYAFQARQRRIHETPARMAELRAALAGAGEHPLAAEAEDAGEAILARWEAWDGELDLPPRPCHGDLKISNLRFADDGRAVALLDLDTLGPMPFASEMGDAWRSWCNRGGEDDPGGCVFDDGIFAASARAWLAAAPPMSERERRALVPAIERIALELAARFCADAVKNVYFREDRARHSEPGRHNLLRARAQLALAGSARECRAACARAVGLA